ncbi:hypothetical protein [Haloarcula amylovorans]|uniref:hypothetical protein n=1 Tax=Haloarcula amylovorans TaxID=2562280 RepID=UPI001075FD41|nr:hypothetical protein [Halomicroarcula amylolytica]
MTVHEMRYAGCSVPLRYGHTTMTIRLAAEWTDVDAGDTLEMVTDDDMVPMTVEETRTVSATDAYVIANASSGHSSYQSLGEFLGVFRRYYPEAGVDATTPLTCFNVTLQGDLPAEATDSVEVVE